MGFGQVEYKQMQYNSSGHFSKGWVVGFYYIKIVFCYTRLMSPMEDYYFYYPEKRVPKKFILLWF